MWGKITVYNCWLFPLKLYVVGPYITSGPSSAIGIYESSEIIRGDTHTAIEQDSASVHTGQSDVKPPGCEIPCFREFRVSPLSLLYKGAHKAPVLPHVRLVFVPACWGNGAFWSASAFFLKCLGTRNWALIVYMPHGYWASIQKDQNCPIPCI